MKTRSIFMMMTALLLTLGAMATNGSNEPLKKAIRKTVTYPDFAKKTHIQGIVLVEFEVVSNGQIVVKNINASHPELGAHVKYVLENMKLNDNSAVGVHFAKFNFRYVDVH